jgi:putative oxygen-independent coproporphyrinogen III oxidase
VKPIAVFRPADIRFTALPPLALYIHIPWCLKKCPYCDFNSHQSPAGALPENDYVDALLADLDSELPRVWGRRLHSIFIGGGTPSLFSAAAIDRLLTQVQTRFGMVGSEEITLEANPGSFEAQKFRDFRAAGVTRLSIGVQSFNDAHLRALGRVHDAGQARAAVELAARVFERFNIDLMYGLPGQTLEQAVQDVEQVLQFSPRHLSLYQLTLEPGTAFAARPPVLPPDDALADIEDAVHACAATAGLERYEVSAFAAPGQAARHNLNYWRFGDYLGIGAGAHGKISLPDRIVRTVRVRQPGHYIAQALAGNARLEEKNVPAAELPFEFMLNALRLSNGVPLEDYAERCGRPYTDIAARVAAAEQAGLLQICDGRLSATPTGYRFLNAVQTRFLSE